MKNKFGLLLFLFLLSQIFFISLQTLLIPLPTRFSEILVNSYLPEGLSVKITNPRVKGLSLLEFNEVSLHYKNKNLAKFQNLSIGLLASPNSKNNFPFIESVKCQEINFLEQENEKPLVKLSQTSLSPQKSSGRLFLFSLLETGSVLAKIKIELCNLNQLFFSEEKKTPTMREEKLLNNLSTFEDFWRQYSESIPPSALTISGFIRPLSGQINLSQDRQLESNWINGLNASIAWKYSDLSDSIIDLQAELHAKKLELSHWGYQGSIKKPSILGALVIDTKNAFLKSKFSVLQFHELSLNSNISGNSAPMFFYLSEETGVNKFCIFSDSNQSRICLVSEKSFQEWQVRGGIQIFPEFNNMYAKLPQGRLKFFRGEKLSVQFWNNPNKVRSTSPVQFLVLAENFSALEAPYGNFRFSGEIDSDFSIYINQAFGKLGKSQVTGTYFQKWHPAEYRFLVNGKCYPSDINNWLGTWWNPIWKDFDFESSSPQGNVSISGVWGGEPGNCHVLGNIITNHFKYRNFRVDSSKINVLLDEHHIQLTSNEISHSHGILQGKIAFPKSSDQSPIFLGFNMKGDFPANEAKQVLGENVEDVLNDFDLSSIYCDAVGEIYKDSPDHANESNRTWFDLYLSTDQFFSYNDVKIDSLDGRLSLEKGLFHANFPQIGVANGKGNLSFNQISEQSNRISLSLELQNMNPAVLHNQNKISSDLSNDKGNKSGSEKEALAKEVIQKKGDFDLSLQAEGPFSDPHQFEGTGLFSLSDIAMGNINLLGGIRSKLGAFNLPLPSDALHFDNLQVPFVLDHEIIRFDNAKLSGPLSLIQAEGEVDWPEGLVDITGELQIAGNLNIPFIKQLVNLADPFSKVTKLKINGTFDNPAWVIHLGTNPLDR